MLAEYTVYRTDPELEDYTVAYAAGSSHPTELQTTGKLLCLVQENKSALAELALNKKSRRVERQGIRLSEAAATSKRPTGKGVPEAWSRGLTPAISCICDGFSLARCD